MDQPTEAKRRRLCLKDITVSKRITSETTGKANKYFHQVKKSFLDRYGEQLEVPGIQTQAADIVRIISDMEEYMRCKSCTEDTLYKNFKRLYECVTCLDRQRNEQELSVRYKRENIHAQIFYDLGGLQAAKRIILLESQLPLHSRHRQESEEKLRMKSVLFEAISRIITTDYVGERVAKELTDEELFTGFFTYLKYDQTYMTACSLIEDLLQYYPRFLLGEIPDMKELILSLEGDKLMNFCRILAIAVSDRDIHESKNCSFAEKKEEPYSVREVNQEYLLQIPELVEQLVIAATSDDNLPRFKGIKAEYAHWMQWIEDSTSDDIFDSLDSDVDVDEFIGGITQPTELDGIWCQQPSMTVINRLIDRAEAVHVLGLLLVGKHQKQAQTVLADTKLVSGLSATFDNFIWVFQGESSEPMLPGPNDIQPEVVLKIQIMKLIHSLCDSSEYKHLLLTKSELAEVRRINEKAGTLAIPGLDRVNRGNMCKGKEGLLTKVVCALQREPTSVSFKFWLSRIVDNYLRGSSSSYCYQVFLLRKGLVQHVINSLLADESNRKEIVQSGFDLLGELTKFNIDAFQVMDDILRIPQQRSRFVDLINKNLVDSHMFIRGVILSFSFFCNNQTVHAEYARNKNFLLSYIGNFQQQVNYLHKLIILITAQSVSQENVGCLNTALMLIMCPQTFEGMVPYLEALKNENITYTNDRKHGSFILKNFRELLVFWKKHYSTRQKHCLALENSTRIKFTEWQRSVETLLNDEISLPTSIVHYIEPSPT